MDVNLTLDKKDVKKIFARYEGHLIYDDSKGFGLIFSTRSMLSNIFVQLPIELKKEIKEKFPRVTNEVRL